MSKSEFPLGDKLHEIIRDMICREIDTIFDSIDEVEKSITGRFGNVSARIYNSEKRIGKLTDKVLQLEEFTGLYNDNEIEDARTSEQIKSDVKKRRQNEKS